MGSSGWPILWVYGFFQVAVVVLAVAAFLLWRDRMRYRGARDGQDDYRPTAEVFRDPLNGRLVRVYEDPRTGRRQYREEEEG